MLTFRFDISTPKSAFRVYGLTAVAALCAFLCLPYVFAARMDRAKAEAMVRDYLSWRMTQDHLAELQRAGMSVPDATMATRWQKELEALKGLRFESVDVKRAYIVPPFRDWTNFVIRTVDRTERREARTRYFWVYEPNIVSEMRETSEFSWKFPL